jgi:hypothetical protein
MKWFKKKQEANDNIKMSKEQLDEALKSAKEDYYKEIVNKLPQHYVQYVVDSPVTLRSYIHGLNVGKHVTMSVMSNIISQIALEVELEVSEDEPPTTTLENIKYSITNGFLPIYNDHYDSEFGSVLYNGIMPNGEVIDIDTVTPETLGTYKQAITKYLSIHDPVPSPITPEYLELRMSQYNNFFNVTCDKCGTPHNFSLDVPSENFVCTLCEHELVIYTNQLFKETNDVEFT